MCARHYKKKKENILKKSLEKYLWREKKKKQECARERYKYFSVTEKERLLDYRKRYYEIQRNNFKVPKSDELGY